METFEYNSPSTISRLLHNRGLGMTKKYGQNFLISPQVREKIVSTLEIKGENSLWEIGPGIGALTSRVLEKCENLTVFEIDYGFASVLRDFFGDFPNFSVIEGDFLKTGIPRLLRDGPPDTIFGNLPYSSGSAMIYKIIEQGVFPKRMVFTVQRETAERMTAQPGKKEHSVFSVICRFGCDVKEIGSVAPGAFFPAPEVISSIVVMVPHRRYDQWKNRTLFFTVVKSVFASRRKTIKNNLFGSPLVQNIKKEEMLDACRRASIDPSRRGEELTVEELKNLTDAIADAEKGTVSCSKG